MKQAEASKTFRATRAAQSLDIDTKKKLRHEVVVEADLDSPYSVGLIVGASGSGKTILAHEIFGDFDLDVRSDAPIIDQFPEALSYDQCVANLTGIGLTSVPCWIRPAGTLSNGQRARAIAALAMAGERDPIVIDEWTSVVDRTVAKVMSHSVQKFARKNKRRLVLISCHYDVIEWLNPDWIIDCNSQKFVDRRSLQENERARNERLSFELRRVDRRTWAGFAQYHYLNDKLPNGQTFTYGLFSGEDQIAFLCFARYQVAKRDANRIWHIARVVVHPDFVGFGLGRLLCNAASDHFCREQRGKADVRITFSTLPLYRSMLKDPEHWQFLKSTRLLEKQTSGASFVRSTFRRFVTQYSFKFIPDYIRAHQRTPKPRKEMPVAGTR